MNFSRSSNRKEAKLTEKIHRDESALVHRVDLRRVLPHEFHPHVFHAWSEWDDDRVLPHYVWLPRAPGN
jgi:hypothetical protein